MKSIDIVIPVHNHSYWLAACLNSLKDEVIKSVNKIYVVDDRSHSIESTNIEKICSVNPKVIFIKNESYRGGFGYACNLGCSFAKADLIVFLNTDCFVPIGIFEKLRDSFEQEDKLALVCPVSNNSPDLTLPMKSGLSYIDMAEMVSKYGPGSNNKYLREACTIVGNCLMVSREFFQSVNGFSEEWGIGYGEETDLQMKAIAKGLLGMVRLDAYVYHFGGGTFNFNVDIEAHRRKNHALFMGKWSKEYRELNSRANSSLLINELNCYTAKATPKVKEYDVIFYLPAIKQGIGGIHAVVALCNQLILEGLRCNIALVGISSAEGLENFKEPILFAPLYYASIFDFVNDSYIFPRIVFSTIWDSAFIVKDFCNRKKSKHIQFVQGYEGYFDNGSNYNLVINSLKSSSHIVTTSKWLETMISTHLENDSSVVRLPLYVDKNIFFTNEYSLLKDREYDVCFIFRASNDKGQWLAREVLERCARKSELKILVLAAQPYFDDIKSSNIVDDLELMPMSQQEIAKRFRKSRVYIDFSLHEGFGLMGLEAALCGCRLVTSDSGGVRDYITDRNGVIVEKTLNLDDYINAINDQLKYMESLIYYDNGVDKWLDYIIKILSRNEFSNKLEIQMAKNKLVAMDRIASKEFIINKVEIFSRGAFIKIMYKIYKKISKYLPPRVRGAIRILFYGV